MTRRNQKHGASQSMNYSKDLSDLIETARKQPGVQDLMAVYETWKEVENAIQPHKKAMGVKRIISLSNESVS